MKFDFGSQTIFETEKKVNFRDDKMSGQITVLIGAESSHVQAIRGSLKLDLPVSMKAFAKFSG